ncbi:MAG: hypothetical protein M1820_010340 [Bogoriella megaspora]|nr:MAG: hypothetical protein M1820_010340 [Bogoriella megaspora]
MTTQEATLSCEQCRNRKIKCDKTSPCSGCLRSGLKCVQVQRARLPRGRTAVSKRRDQDLNDRIKKLEGLISGLARGSSRSQSEYSSSSTTGTPFEHGQPTSNHADAVLSAPLPEQESPQKTSNAKSDFWMVLSNEVAGIREVLENADEETAGSTDDSLKDSGEARTVPEYDVILFDSDSYIVNPQAISRLADDHVQYLVQIFFDRVDSIIKTMHRPSLFALVPEYLECDFTDVKDPALVALFSSMQLLAVCAMSEQECERDLNVTKDWLERKLRCASEVWLSRAGILESTSQTVLHAFIIYLFAIRSLDSGRRTWTLLASAVRIARALRLNEEPLTGSILEIEMRRRLWYALCLLDIYTALDRGSESLISIRDFSVCPPRNISDVDFLGASELVPTNSDRFTDMTFTCMTHDLIICHFELERMTALPELDWAKRRQLVIDTEAEIQRKYLQYCDMSKTFHRFTSLSAGDTLTTLYLLARRPMYRFAQRPPRENFDVLDAATEVLERSMLKQQDVTLSNWMWLTWVKWYALAVVLAELCSRTEGHSVVRAWYTVESAFNQYSKHVADSSSGSLWRPIKKLMQKAQALRTATAKSLQPLDLSAFTYTEPLATENQMADDNFVWPMGHDNTFVGEQVFPTCSDSSSFNDPSYLDKLEDISWSNWQSFLEDFITRESQAGPYEYEALLDRSALTEQS